MALTGSCLCGAVRYEVAEPFLLIGNCHCSLCRKASGAAYVSWGIVNPGTFRWTTGEELVHGYDSSPGNTRCYCSRCGSSLASSQHGEVSAVALGCLDDDPGDRPSAHIFVGSKASWHTITDALPQHAEWPPDGANG